MITLKITLKDRDGRMQLHYEGDSEKPCTQYECDFAEELTQELYGLAHAIAKKHNDPFHDLTPLRMIKRRDK